MDNFRIKLSKLKCMFIIYDLCSRTADAVRTTAMTGLQALIQNKELASGIINELGSEILPQVNIV